MGDVTPLEPAHTKAPAPILSSDELHPDLIGVWIPRWLLLQCGGDARDAAVLASIQYWIQPSDRDASPRTRRVVVKDGCRWFYITDAELGAEIGMDKGTVYRARRSLQKRGFIESERARFGDEMVNRVRVLRRTS